MPRPVHFDIMADDPQRALKFYESVFGWKSQKWEGPMEYWLLRTGENGEQGIDGGLSRRCEETNHSLVNTIQVESVDEFATRVKEGGGQITRDKSPIPGVGYLAYCLDTEGNPFGIIEMDESAA